MSAALDEHEAWIAVSERDGRFDGRLVYAVVTTGVYCRPSCPARRPRREHARFFPTPDDAESAGFRACRRCHPSGADPVRSAVEGARRHLDLHAGERVTLAELGAHVGLSPSHLQRVFKRETGASPREYAAARRAARLREALREHDGDTLRAVFDAGFPSASAAYASSDAFIGMTPASYARGGAGVTIRYALADTPLGRILVAATDRGVCAIALGERDAELEADLRAEFPLAALTRDDDRLGSLCRALGALREPSPELPLDVRATDFQWRVWRALRAIPPGSTLGSGPRPRPQH